MLGESDIEKLVRLARLSLSSSELTELAGELPRIVDYVSELNSFSAAAPSDEVRPQQNVLREDGEPHPSRIFRQDLLSLAPQSDGRFVKVSKVIDRKKT